jgi:hypothetical protein
MLDYQVDNQAFVVKKGIYTEESLPTYCLQ